MKKEMKRGAWSVVWFLFPCYTKDMPFRSQAQRKYLFKNKPKVAAEFAKNTPKGKRLPLRVKKRKKKK